MRPWLLMAVVPVLAGVASAQTTVVHDGWTEFKPAWHFGPANYTFQNRSLSVPADIRYATDGETYLYVSSGGVPDSTGCAAPAKNGTFVLVTNGSCVLSGHPTIACMGMAAMCENATGVMSNPMPTPTPIMGPDCSGSRFAMCTPAPGAALVVGALMGCAFAWRRGGSR